MITRTNCLICNKKININFLREDKKIPILNNTTNENYSNDIFIEYNIQYCNECDFFQNKYLGDINLVYNKNNHNSNIVSEIWIKHHNQFFNFIKKFNINNYFLEIGPGSFYLSKLLIINEYNYVGIEPVLNINIRDINIVNDFYENVEFSQYKNFNVILSHVFEHLYSFDIFFEKIKDNENIFISIPNFEYYLEDCNFNFLNIEHTFLYSTKNIINIFKRHSYNLIKMEKFERHSIFFYFKKSYDSKLKVTKEQLNVNYLNFEKFYNKTVNNIQIINNFIETNNQYEIILFPCSMLLQSLNCLGLDFKNVKYCFDNNKFKHNMRLYGTKLICLSLDDIKKIFNHLVIIFNTCYSLEIEKQFIKDKIRYKIL